MESVQQKPNRLTLEQLEAEANAADAPTAPVEVAQPVVPTPEPVTPAPTPEPVETPAPAPVAEKVDPVVETPSEIEVLKEKLAEMTKRVRDGDGRHGGELAAIRTEMTETRNRLRQAQDEIEELRKQKPAAPVPPPEPDPLDVQYPELAKGMDKRTQPAIEAARRAELAAQETREELRKLRESQISRDYSERFMEPLKKAVPNLDDINNDPEFKQFCAAVNEETGEQHQELIERCQRNMNPGPVIKLLQKWEKRNTPPPESQPAEPKGPKKPSLAAQVEVSKSVQSTPSKKVVPREDRIRELELKLKKSGFATKEDGLEYDRLLDEQMREGKT